MDVAISGVLKQVADLAGGEPPQYVIHSEKPITVKDGGQAVTLNDVSVSNGLSFRDELAAAAKANTPVSLTVPVEVNTYGGLDSPSKQVFETTLTPEHVTEITGKPVSHAPGGIW